MTGPREFEGQPIDEDLRIQVGQFLGLNQEIQELVGHLRIVKPEVFVEGASPFAIISGDCSRAALLYHPPDHHTREGSFVTSLELTTEDFMPVDIHPYLASREKPLAMQISRCADGKYNALWEQFIQRATSTPVPDNNKKLLDYLLRHTVIKTAYRASISGNLEKYVYLPPSDTQQEAFLQAPTTDEGARVLGALLMNSDPTPGGQREFTPVPIDHHDLELVHHALTEIRTGLSAL